MRETPEAMDDLPVLDGEGQVHRIGKRRLEQGDGALLLGERFRVHEGQVEEGALSGGVELVEPARDCVLRDRQPLRVRRESAGRIAEQVSRELVENEEEVVR